MAYIYSLADTWNASGTTFTGIGLNVTDSASAAASMLMDLQVGGVSQFNVSKAGVVRQPAIDFGSAAANFVQNTGEIWARNNTNFADNNGIRLLARGFKAQGNDYFGFAAGNSLGTTPDVTLFRDAANTLAQRNGVNAQAFNLYNTYTDASNYERGRMAWVSNTLTIGSDKAGTGSPRGMRLEVGGTGTSLDLGGGIITFINAALNLGGTTSAFPALKRSTTSMQVRLADDSAFTNIQGKLTTDTAYTAGAPTATGYIVLFDSTGTAYRVPAVAN